MEYTDVRTVIESVFQSLPPPKQTFAKLSTAFRKQRNRGDQIMHGEKETTQAPRITCTLVHRLFLVIAAWIYFGGGIETLSTLYGAKPRLPGDLLRRIVLFYLLKRKFAWDEFGGVVFALFLYQVVFALLRAGEAAA